jgi:hypothetical protein
MKTRKTKRYGKKTRKNFFLNFDVYIDQNPADTIPIKYTTVADVKRTIRTLEHLYKTKQYSHKRIWQVGMILYVRLRALKKIKPEQFAIATKYFRFLQHRTTLPAEQRYTITFGASQ